MSTVNPGALVISLDFELHWGVRDQVPAQGRYTRNLLGAREAVPALLDIFARRGISATWAVVGFLYGRSGADLQRFHPRQRPAYANAALSPYNEPVGSGEQADPLHLAASLIDRIRRTPGQEIATHTYSHFYCLEDGSDECSFAADLDSALAIAARCGDRPRSLVFPRNEIRFRHILKEREIGGYRGNEQWLRFERIPRGGRLLFLRACRFLDNYVNVTGPNLAAWGRLADQTGLVNIPSSRFLRPYSRALAWADPLRLRRISRDLNAAAATGAIYHLWWHPHNFGAHLDRNCAFLNRILDHFDILRNRCGMQSLTMAAVADRVRAAVPCAAAES